MAAPAPLTRQRSKTASSHDMLVKLLLIGDSGVGKSCMLLRFVNDEYTSAHITTIGIDFKIRTEDLDVPLPVRAADVGTTPTTVKKRVKMQVWDTAGQERFRTITTAYYRGAHGIMLVYDVGDDKSFSNIRNWMRNIEQHAPQGVHRVLVGNKCDDEEKRVIGTERGEALAAEYGIPFFETSAKSGARVEEAFFSFSRGIVAASLEAAVAQQSAAVATPVVLDAAPTTPAEECAC